MPFVHKQLKKLVKALDKEMQGTIRQKFYFLLAIFAYSRRQQNLCKIDGLFVYEFTEISFYL
ncbi:MAG: hypothetical protein K0S74_1659 [Chlamydiales bacterium]|jgi:hypothetical protein|nr:hypothetical protein [Chlamydiales bacterium]